MAINSNVRTWLWKWHYIGGLMSFPVVLVLALTGIIYLFKDNYEAPIYKNIKQVEIGEQQISYQRQLEIATAYANRPINAMIIPKVANQATEFVIGKFGGKSSYFINPYTGEVMGKLAARDTDMFKVRKLHGELLAGSFGTKIVELVGSWMIVLIISGLILFFPAKIRDWKKLFQIRIHANRSIFFLDLHRVGGFWFSMLLLLIIAGGMPWTDVFGNGFKWIQLKTHTGYPLTWQGTELKSTVTGNPTPLDEIVTHSKRFELPGEVTITLPTTEHGVYSIHNINHQNQSQQVAIHLDQYSGQTILQLGWHDVGFLMQARMWAMAFHQGQFGLWNWVLVLFTAVGLLLLSAAAVISYFIKSKGKVRVLFKNYSSSIGYVYPVAVTIMGLILPVFGISVLVIWLIQKIWQPGASRFRKVDIS